MSLLPEAMIMNFRYLINICISKMRYLLVIHCHRMSREEDHLAYCR